MLTSTEKILSVVALALTVAVGFSLLQYNSAMDEMTQLRQEQVEHVDMVNQEFKQRVKAVELENIGQGKEIKRGQDRITDNTKLIYTKADSLGSLIDDLAYEIKRVDRDLTKKIKNVQRDLEGLEDNFDSEKRRTRRALSDIKKQLKKLDAAVFPPEEEVEGDKRFGPTIVDDPVEEFQDDEDMGTLDDLGSFDAQRVGAASSSSAGPEVVNTGRHEPSDDEKDSDEDDGDTVYAKNIVTNRVHKCHSDDLANCVGSRMQCGLKATDMYNFKSELESSDIKCARCFKVEMVRF